MKRTRCNDCGRRKRQTTEFFYWKPYYHNTNSLDDNGNPTTGAWDKICKVCRNRKTRHARDLSRQPKLKLSELMAVYATRPMTRKGFKHEEGKP